MYQVKKFMCCFDIATFLNENPLYEYIQILQVKDGIYPYRLLYKSEEDKDD